MSILKNLLNAFVPVRERREASGTLNALNAEIVFTLNGDESVAIFGASSAFIGTLEFSGSIDGVNFGGYAAFPYSPAWGGTGVPVAGQPILSQGLVAANTSVHFFMPSGQLRAIRVRVSAYTSGSLSVTMNSDTQKLAHIAADARVATLFVSSTGAVGAAVTATLPAAAGLRHILREVRVTRSATAALTASATPVLVTTTNLPGGPTLTFGQDVAGIGIDKEASLPVGGDGLAAIAIGGATTIACPAYVGVVWRVNVAYRVGL